MLLMMVVVIVVDQILVAHQIHRMFECVLLFVQILLGTTILRNSREFTEIQRLVWSDGSCNQIKLFLLSAAITDRQLNDSRLKSERHWALIIPLLIVHNFEVGRKRHVFVQSPWVELDFCLSCRSTTCRWLFIVRRRQERTFSNYTHNN